MSENKNPIEVVTKPLAELAMAEQEQQKTIQAAIGLTEKAGAFLGRIFGPAADEVGLAWGERTRLWRFKRLNRAMLEVERMARERELHPDAMKELPFGMAVRVIDALSNEEDDTVQDMWARLMANAIDPESGVTIKKVHVDVLKSMSSAEAILLDLLWTGESARVRNSHEIEALNQRLEEIAQDGWRRIDAEERRVAVQNLVRLRCITIRPNKIDAHDLFAQIERDGFRQWAAVDPRSFERVLNEILSLVSIAAGLEDPKARPAPKQRLYGSINVPELSFALTPLGRGLMGSCRRPQPDFVPATDERRAPR